MEPKYLQQYQRVKRYLSQLEAKNKSPLVHNNDLIEYEDALWTFFQHCWHLKDWIKYDDSVPEGIRKSVEDEVKAFENIMICADMANATKHLKPKVTEYSPKAGADKRVDVNIHLGPTMGDSIYRYRINVEGGKAITRKAIYEAIDVARNSVNEWEVYLKCKGLLT